MREGICEQGQRLLTATEKARRVGWGWKI